MEIWKAIPGHTGYEVSDHGNVRALERVVPSERWASGLQKRPATDLIPLNHARGYLRVSLRRPIRSVFIHVLVLEAFVGPRPEGYDGCHKDGDRKNNYLNNLYWGSRSENMQDAIRHGTFFSPWRDRAGEAHSQAKLTVESVKEMRRLRASGAKLRLLSIRFGVAECTVSAVCNGRLWKLVA